MERILSDEQMKQKELEGELTREARGARLFSNGNVLVLPEQKVSYVQSDTNAEIVYKIEGGICECPDFQRRQKACKHQYAVAFYGVCSIG